MGKKHIENPTQLDEGAKRLAHYNEWLLDPNRPFGTIYPGYQTSTKPTKGKKMPSTVIADMTKVLTKEKKVAIKPAKKAARVSDGPRAGSKSELAVEIYKRLKGDKASVIAAFQSELSMSVAGATTYFYNAKKAA
jgi:hypothetical protein